MQLELGIAEACGASTCRVRRLRGGEVVDAPYSPRVLNTVKVRPGDLVALDTSGEQPALVWRWWRGTVEQTDAGVVQVRRNGTQQQAGDPRTVVTRVELPPQVAHPPEIGGEVWYGGTPRTVVAVGRGGLPVDLAALERSLLDGVSRALTP